jgi:hypothetical protein
LARVTPSSPARRLGARVAVVAVAVVVAGAAGWAVGQRSADPVTVSSALPIHGVSPSVPVFVPYSPDVKYPALETHLDYVTRTIGQKPFQWTYSVPKGWVSNAFDTNEVRWGPAGAPRGVYFLRVKLIASHLTPAEMVQQKYDALNDCCEDVTLIQRQWNTLGVTYRETDTNYKRWDVFRWLTSAGSDEAQFEMSVVGRAVDDPGLEDLMTRVSASVTRTQ